MSDTANGKWKVLRGNVGTHDSTWNVVQLRPRAYFYVERLSPLKLTICLGVDELLPNRC